MDKQDLLSTILDKVKKEISYTAILVIAYQERDGELKILTGRDYFLAHCSMNPELSAVDQKYIINKYLKSVYRINETDIINVIPMSEEPTFSIKPVHDKLNLNGFVIFKVHLKKRVKATLINNKSIEWLTLGEMRKRPEAMGTNIDVINMLEELYPELSDSFEDFIGPLHIIWNITKQCEYNCDICATSDPNRTELNAKNKLKVLNSICTAKDRIRILDFAGGDPCCSEDSIVTIEVAINSLEADHVSVTTTGKGLRKLSEDIRTKLLMQCEITIDAAHESLSDQKAGAFSRREGSYCSTNIEQVQTFSDNLRKIVINIPILDDDLTDEEMDILVNKIAVIKEKNPRLAIETQLLRLMPVGAFALTHKKEDYIRYNPTNSAKAIKEKINAIGVECRFHCSLRILPELNERKDACKMLEKKIGIDCAGNVFACAWGAYLPLNEGKSIKDNPFYLGNLTETSLNKLLNGTNVTKTEQYMCIAKEINNQERRSFCSVVSSYTNNKIFENHDPLSKLS